MELTDILRCPSAGNRLCLGENDSVVHVHGTGVTYPIVAGIVDFCPDAKDKISKAYDAYSSRYDAYMAYATSPYVGCREAIVRTSQMNCRTRTIHAERLKPNRFEPIH